ncbi:MAG: asparaginase [Fretibacterium sp.]|nr:asparaginase [Fretibacterium sp.]
MKLILFSTGGTIASIPSEEGLRPGLTGDGLLRLCPELMGFDHDIEVVNLMSRDSTDMQPADWLLMAEQIRSRAPTCDAAILLHGTDTLAWTAAALSYLLHDVPLPVVATGSMLPAGDSDSDAPDNLFAAVQFAMQLAMYRRRGVSIAFGGTLIHGVRAAKADTRHRRAFVSVDYPLLGEMKDKGTHQIAWLNAQTPKFSEGILWGPSPELERRVALVPLFPGMEARLLDAVIETGPRAVVLEGYGLGGVPGGELLHSIRRGISSGIPFIMRAQALFGGVDLDTYEVGHRAVDLGVLSAHDMTREALMVKLMLLLPLCTGGDTQQLGRLLSANLCDDVLR